MAVGFLTHAMYKMCDTNHIPRATAYGPAAWPLGQVNFWIGRIEEAYGALPYPGEALFGE